MKNIQISKLSLNQGIFTYVMLENLIKETEISIKIHSNNSEEIITKSKLIPDRLRIKIIQDEEMELSSRKKRKQLLKK